MSALQKQKRTSESGTLSFILLVLEIVRPHRTRGLFYDNAVCPSLDGEIEDIRSQIKVLEDVEERLAGLDGKDKDTMDSEEVRMMAKRRAIQTGDSHNWDEMEKLHELRLQLSERLNASAQNARPCTYRLPLVAKLTIKLLELLFSFMNLII